MPARLLATPPEPKKHLQGGGEAKRANLAVQPAEVALHAVHDPEQVARPQPHLLPAKRASRVMMKT